MLSRKRIACEVRLDMPVGLTRQHALASEPGGVRELILGEPGLRYTGPWTADIQHGWLVVLGVANTGTAAIRSTDFSTPLAFAFAGREIHAVRLIPEPAGRTQSRAAWVPAVQLSAQNAGPGAARVQFSGNFLLRPGDSYSLVLILTGTVTDETRRIQHEGSLAGGSIMLPPGGETARGDGDGAPADGRRDDGGQQPVRDGGEPVP